MPSVTFYFPDHPNPSIFDSVDPHRDWRVFKTGRDQWIPYTYVSLRQAGHAVSIAGEPPREGIAVVFAADLRRFFEECRRRKDIVVVATQADRRIPELLLADIVIQHNHVEVDNKRFFFIPNWPQGGLVPRDPSRGRTVEVVSYKGRFLNLDKMFLSTTWSEFLAERGMRFRIDASDDEPVPDLTGLTSIEVDTSMRWNDFSDVDIVLAVRPPDPQLHPHKPSLKLVNAWHAGVPALLGAELGYREVRRSDLDYIEVSSLEDAMDGIVSLKEDPNLYERMTIHGQTRAAEFSTLAVRELWQHLLFDRLANWKPSRVVQMSRPYLAPVIRGLRRTRRALQQHRTSHNTR